MTIANLRLKILEEAYQMISEDGFDSFSVRNLSRRLGISHNTMYRHYKSKMHLVTTLVQSGFEHLISAFKAVRERDDLDEVEKFKECAYIYIEFAVNNPNIYKVMFLPDLFRDEIPEDLMQLFKENYSKLFSCAEDCVRSGSITRGTAYSVSNMVWACSHGLASFLIKNMLPLNKALDCIPPFMQQGKTGKESSIHDAVAFSIDVIFDGLSLSGKRPKEIKSKK